MNMQNIKILCQINQILVLAYLQYQKHALQNVTMLKISQDLKTTRYLLREKGLQLKLGVVSTLEKIYNINKEKTLISAIMMIIMAFGVVGLKLSKKMNQILQQGCFTDILKNIRQLSSMTNLIKNFKKSQKKIK